MPNMSYCRFQNTVVDMEDCNEALNELIEGEEEVSEISQAERQAMEKMAGIVAEMVAGFAELGIEPSY